MDFLLLGRELPAFNLRLEKGKPPYLRYENHALVRLRRGWYGTSETLRWIDLILDDVETEAFATAYRIVIQRFAELIGEDHPTQLSFFKRCVEWGQTQPALTGTDKSDFENVLEEPALLPFVWMNWLPCSLPDAPSAPTAPFRVDFVLLYEGRRLVIELNSPTQFTEYVVDPQLRGMRVHPCYERFTMLLRQDRWLRRQGWEVFRFSQQEVEMEPIELFMADLGVWSR